jgi:CTP synthase (UTP-ammonia lyase)
VAGIPDAAHEEMQPDAAALVINKLSCSLAGVSQAVKIETDSMAHTAYGQSTVIEQFTCNYGLNETYRPALKAGNLYITGLDEEGNARIIELSEHPFYAATLFLPQLSSQERAPHPLILSFIQAAMANK